jgi:predicted ABC-type exoprotein transport system permease subunit
VQLPSLIANKCQDIERRQKNSSLKPAGMFTTLSAKVKKSHKRSFEVCYFASATTNKVPNNPARQTKEK